MLGNSKYVSVDTIIAKVYRDMGLSETIDTGDAIEWAGEAMDLIGATVHLLEKVAPLKVENYRAKLPCDLYYVTTAAGKPIADIVNYDECDLQTETFIPMRYSTDAYHHWRCGKSEDHCCSSSVTYTMNDDYIFPNFETGYILLSYSAMPVDDNGYPKIPDDAKFKEAVAGHIKWRLGFIQWMNGKMPGAVYQKLEQDRDWYIGAAQNRDKMPSIDMAESLKNNWLRLIPKINQHQDGFKSSGDQEHRYSHNSI